jgi:probable rRNA maturation factor
MSVDIKNFTRGNVPYKDLPLCAIKEKVLGKNYELSLAFVGDTRSKNLNKKYRGKDKPTNILSFELSKTSGEIIINPRLVKKEAPLFKRSYKNFLAFLFIHGLYHLEGMQHGSIMEEAEKKIRKIYNI